MAGKLTFGELVSKVAKGQITKEETQRLFRPDYIGSQGFQPRFTLNFGEVDASGVEEVAIFSAQPLALEAMRSVQRRGTSNRRTGAPIQAPILAEGDSWFSHPLVATVIDKISDDGFQVRNIAEAGATLEEMINKQEYKAYLQRGRVSVFLFSGGGNDILGENLRRCLNLYSNLHNRPEQADYYIKPDFYAELEGIKKLYGRLLNQIEKVSPQTQLMVHGYAYARPGVAGPYLGRHFEYLGFDVHLYRDLVRAIIKIMVDKYNDFLSEFARHNSSAVQYVDFRRTLHPDRDEDWYDEIHPSSEGAARMAQQLEPLLPRLVAERRRRAA
jgi:lysophospholipase L1-like esterase